MPGDYPLGAGEAPGARAIDPAPGGPGMLNSMEMMRDEYLHELPKSINIHSNSGSAKQRAAKPGGKNE